MRKARRTGRSRAARWVAAGFPCAACAAGACLYDVAGVRDGPAESGPLDSGAEAPSPQDTRDVGSAQASDAREPDAPGARDLDAQIDDPGATCSEASAALGAYVITEGSSTETSGLYTFTEPNQLKLVGDLRCGSAGGESPWDMAVSQDGTIWVVYDSGQLFRVNPKDAGCTPVSYVSNPDFLVYGMTFERPDRDTAEQLFVSDTTYRSTLHKDYDASHGIAVIDRLPNTDADTWQISPIGLLPGRYAGLGGELAGTGDGRLFIFLLAPDGGPTTLAQLAVEDGGLEIDASVGRSLGLRVATGSSVALLFWRGSFWIFAAAGDGPSTVWRFDPGLQAATNAGLARVGDASVRVIGAGASTCATAE